MRFNSHGPPRSGGHLTKAGKGDIDEGGAELGRPEVLPIGGTAAYKPTI